MAAELGLAALSVVLQGWADTMEEAEAVALSATGRRLRFLPEIAFSLGHAACRALERHVGWWVHEGFRVSFDVEANFEIARCGQPVSSHTAWDELADVLPPLCLQVHTARKGFSGADR